MNDTERILFMIMFSIGYVLISSMASFRMLDMFGDDTDVQKLAKHFLLWPIEMLFIIILNIIIIVKEYKEEHR